MDRLESLLRELQQQQQQARNQSRCNGCQFACQSDVLLNILIELANRLVDTCDELETLRVTVENLIGSRVTTPETEVEASQQGAHDIPSDPPAETSQLGHIASVESIGCSYQEDVNCGSGSEIETRASSALNGTASVVRNDNTNGLNGTSSISVIMNDNCNGLNGASSDVVGRKDCYSVSAGTSSGLRSEGYNVDSETVQPGLQDYSGSSKSITEDQYATQSQHYEEQSATADDLFCPVVALPRLTNKQISKYTSNAQSSRGGHSQSSIKGSHCQLRIGYCQPNTTSTTDDTLPDIGGSFVYLPNEPQSSDTPPFPEEPQDLSMSGTVKTVAPPTDQYERPRTRRNSGKKPNKVTVQFRNEKGEVPKSTEPISGHTKRPRGRPPKIRRNQGWQMESMESTESYDTDTLVEAEADPEQVKKNLMEVFSSFPSPKDSSSSRQTARSRKRGRRRKLSQSLSLDVDGEPIKDGVGACKSMASPGQVSPRNCAAEEESYPGASVAELDDCYGEVGRIWMISGGLDTSQPQNDFPGIETDGNFDEYIEDANVSLNKTNGVVSVDSGVSGMFNKEPVIALDRLASNGTGNDKGDQESARSKGWEVTNQQNHTDHSIPDNDHSNNDTITDAELQQFELEVRSATNNALFGKPDGIDPMTPTRSSDSDIVFELYLSPEVANYNSKVSANGQDQLPSGDNQEELSQEVSDNSSNSIFIRSGGRNQKYYVAQTDEEELFLSPPSGDEQDLGSEASSSEFVTPNGGHLVEYYVPDHEMEPGSLAAPPGEHDPDLDSDDNIFSLSEFNMPSGVHYNGYMSGQQAGAPSGVHGEKSNTRLQCDFVLPSLRNRTYSDGSDRSSRISRSNRTKHTQKTVPQTMSNAEMAKQQMSTSSSQIGVNNLAKPIYSQSRSSGSYGSRRSTRGRKRGGRSRILGRCAVGGSEVPFRYLRLVLPDAGDAVFLTQELKKFMERPGILELRMSHLSARQYKMLAQLCKRCQLLWSRKEQRVYKQWNSRAPVAADLEALMR